MLKNYFKIALRNTFKNKLYSSINIIGLAVGLSACILISLWVKDELSFDTFHKNSDSIYRIIMETKSLLAPVSPAPLGPKIKEELSEIIKYTRVVKAPGLVFRYKQKSYLEDQGIISDSSIFNIFTFAFLKGDARKALIDPASIVITQSMANKYFGNENPVNKFLTVRGGQLYKVTGLIADIPHNSTLQFDFIIPISMLKIIGFNMDMWGDFTFVTYLQLSPNTNSAEIAKKINRVYNRNITQSADIHFSLQHLKDIHFSSGLQYDPALAGDIKYVYIFSLAAFFILFIASMNFINLTTARSTVRFKEIGVRKSVGANRSQLIIQFFIESLLVIIFSIIISITLVEVALPTFNLVSGKFLTINFLDYRIILGLVSIIVLTALMAETYPALYLSALNPAKGFKGDHLSSNKGHILRKVLIVMQFSLSIGLIIATSVIYRQISYMKNTTPGFNDEGLIYLPVRENSVKYFQPFKESLLQYPDIISVAYKDFLPTDDGHAVMSTQQESSPSLDWEGRNKNEVKLEFNIVDLDYFKTMGMKVIKGRNFSKDFESDENEAFILNEEAVNQMQIKDPVGKWIKMNELKGKIVGVVKNAHFGSLQYKTSPQVFFLLTKQKFADPNGAGIVFIKIKENSIAKTLANIKEQWEKVNPGNPFEFHFLNETIDNLYRAEMKINTIFNYFTLFAIFISCLGLFGLSSFMIEQKRKEIGIRKVLGASIFGIVSMLTKSYAKWILAANIIAWPAAYYVMDKWLQNYEYHISIGLWVFVFAGITALFISLVTVSVQAIKAAASNPVNSLRNE